MRFGSTLAMVGVALALGAYVKFVDVPADASKREAETAAKKLLDFKRDGVVALDVPIEDGKRARIVRGDGSPAKANDPKAQPGPAASGEKSREWRIVQPLETAAEEPAVTGLLTGLERLEKEFELDKPPSDLARFGFSDDKKIRIETGEGEPWTVTLGGDAPVGGQRYVRVEGRRAGFFGVKKFQTDGLETDLYKLRDKRLTLIDPSDVQSLTVRDKGALVARADRNPSPVGSDAAPKQDAAGAGAAEPAQIGDAKPQEWRLREPVEDRGDVDRISRMIQDLYFARATGFVDEPKEPKTYGLDKPEVDVDLVTAKATQHLRMGRASGKTYLQVDDRAPIFEVSDRTLDGVPRDTFAYRYKRVLSLPERSARRVELLFPRDGTQYAMVRDGDDKPWKPETTDLKLADPGKVDELLLQLYSLDAIALIDKPDRAKLGLEPPRLRVTVRGADGKELGWLEVGDTDDQGLLVSSSQTPQVWRVKKELADVAPLGREAFRARWEVSEPAKSPEGEGKPDPAKGSPKELPPGHPHL